MKSDTNWQEQKRLIRNELEKRMDFLIGSVNTYHHKCSKTCRCNKGKGHLGHHLSVNIDGKTKNFYLNKEAVDEARLMVGAFAEVKQLLKELSMVNYHLLREKIPGARRRKISQQSRTETS